MAEYDVSVPSIERNGEENDLEEIPFCLSLSLFLRLARRKNE